MKVVILLGERDEYLSYLKFDSEMEVNDFIESIEDLMLANIENKLTLKERLKLAPYYFPLAGRVQGFEVVV